MGIVMAALGWHTFQNSYLFGFSPPTRREMGLGIASNMPVDAVDYVARRGITGRCLPSYNSAAMLIHRTWPGVKVAMDSRNDVYGEKVYLEFVQALQGGGALEAYLNRHQIDFLLLSYSQDRNPAVYSFLDGSPEWTLVYFDDKHVVYLRTEPRYEEILRSDGYRLISPARTDVTEIRQEDAAEWLQEAERAVAAAPDAWSPLQYKSKALMALQRPDDAIEATKQLLRINPGAFFAWQDLAFLYFSTGHRDEAEQAFLSCLSVQPGFRPCQEGLMRLRSGRP
jgi:tetratricopeptide (TPR) repeat protein